MKKFIVALLSLAFLFPFITGEGVCDPNPPPPSGTPDFSRAIFVNADVSGTVNRVHVQMVFNTDKTGSIMVTELASRGPSSSTGTWDLTQTSPVKITYNFSSVTGGYSGARGYVIFYENGQADILLQGELEFMGTWYQE